MDKNSLNVQGHERGSLAESSVIAAYDALVVANSITSDAQVTSGGEACQSNDSHGDDSKESAKLFTDILTADEQMVEKDESTICNNDTECKHDSSSDNCDYGWPSAWCSNFARKHNVNRIDYQTALQLVCQGDAIVRPCIAWTPLWPENWSRNMVAYLPLHPHARKMLLDPDSSHLSFDERLLRTVQQLGTGAMYCAGVDIAKTYRNELVSQPFGSFLPGFPQHSGMPRCLDFEETQVYKSAERVEAAEGTGSGFVAGIRNHAIAFGDAEDKTLGKENNERRSRKPDMPGWGHPRMNMALIPVELADGLYLQWYLWRECPYFSKSQYMVKNIQACLAQGMPWLSTNQKVLENSIPEMRYWWVDFEAENVKH